MGKLAMAWYKLISYRFKTPKMPDIFGLRAKKEETELIRARESNGQFIADDPKTPQNEAWEEKPKRKKRGPYKKRAKKK